jgi:WD40 repeat protein
MGFWNAVYPDEEGRESTGDGFRVIKLWQPAQRTTPTSLPSRHPVSVAAFSPDGATLATAAGLMITLWDTATWRERATLKGHVREVTALAFTPDGTALVSGGLDRSVRLWDVASGLQRAAHDWRIGKVHAVAVSPDGLTAAAAGESSDIVLWDIDSA